MSETARSTCAGALALLCASTAAADVKLENAWLRPAYAGQPAAMVYVDVRSTETLKLVSARSPVAASARLVLVDPPGAEAEFHRVVDELPVAANGLTRLAYLGSHVRLIDVRQDLMPGSRVALELTFVDAKGARRVASTEAVIRGISARRPGDDGSDPVKP